MDLTLPSKVKEIIGVLESAGFEAYAVGGCVRDCLLGKEPKDWDLTTSASPHEVKELFSHTIDTGIQHGTVTVMLDKEGFEVTTYRIDGKYEDGRHPTEVVFTRSLEEDLKRRDFTINAMAYNESHGLVDLFCGQQDLEQKKIRCVGDAHQRFSEDALRMMRAVRFAAQIGCEIEEDTYQAMKDLAENMQKISAERIQSELVKILTSPRPEYLLKLYETGITQVILPEFDQMMATEQHHPHHKYSVGIHTIEAMKAIEKDKILRLTMLFHDVGKPRCHRRDERGIDHFYNHPVRGEEMTSQIMRRLKFDNDTRRKVCRLVRYHDERPPLNEVNLRRLISNVGKEMYPLLLQVQVADMMGQSEFKREEKRAYYNQCNQLYQQILARGDCLTVQELAVDGKDLMQAGVPQGKEVGEKLAWMLEQVLERPELNQKPTLLELLKKG